MVFRPSISAPAEVTAPPADERAYEEWRKADTLHAPYKVPGYLLDGIRCDGVEDHNECPLLCFVNARSGGRQGAELALMLSRAVGRVQVFDIGDKDHRPDKVLSRFYDTLRAREAAGDQKAATVRQRLRLLVCGGDGTIAWVMGVVKKLKIQPEPPIAIIPLGTGNDLSRSFLWGGAYDRKWIRGHANMYKTLNHIAVAREDKLDCWNITITTPRKNLIASGIPHSLAPPQPPPAQPTGLMTPPGRQSAPSIALASASGAGFGRGQSSSLSPSMAGGGPAVHPAVAAARDSSVVGGGDRSVAASVVATLGSATPLHNIATSSVGSAATTFTTATNMSLHTGAAQAGTSLPPTIMSGNSAEEDSGIGVLGGMFWNYFSVGLDAKAAWGFHSLREERPGCTNSRAANQFWYSAFSCTSGWFCCSQSLRVKATLEVLKPGPGGEQAGWQPVKIPHNVKALVVLNLQSYAGGRNLWGSTTSERDTKKHGFKKPSHHDGILEVVGMMSGWHSGMVMASNGDLVHAKRICQAAGVRVALSAPYVRRDGEPSHCYMQVDGEPWKQDIPVKGVEAPVRVEIVHNGVSRLLRNEPLQRQMSIPLESRSKAPSRTTPNPLVSAVSEPGGVAMSPSLSSIQLPVMAPGSTPQLGGGSTSGPLPQSVVAALTPGAAGAGTKPSVSGSGPLQQPSSATARLGRPSAASAAGSSTTAGGDAAAGDGAGGQGGGGGTGSMARTVASSKQGDGGADGNLASPANGSPTHRTMSAGSQSARSMVAPE